MAGCATLARRLEFSGCRSKLKWFRHIDFHDSHRLDSRRIQSHNLSAGGTANELAHSFGVRQTTKAGQTYSGIVSQIGSNREVMFLMLGINQQVRIPRDEIAVRSYVPTSLMPEGYAALLTSKELTDLLAFLRAQK